MGISNFIWVDDIVVKFRSRAIIRLMRLEHYPAEKLKKEIVDIIGKYLDLRQYKIFFFGSRVSGGGTDRSDIDIGIEGLIPIPAGAWLNIQEEIENFPTLYKMEIVDFTNVAPIFKGVAMQDIEVIWPPQHDQVPSRMAGI